MSKLPTVEETCIHCGYVHSEFTRLAEEYHKSHSIPFTLVGGRIKTQAKHQCGGCMKQISTSYKYCIDCLRTNRGH